MLLHRGVFEGGGEVRATGGKGGYVEGISSLGCLMVTYPGYDGHNGTVVVDPTKCSNGEPKLTVSHPVGDMEIRLALFCIWRNMVYPRRSRISMVRRQLSRDTGRLTPVVGAR